MRLANRAELVGVFPGVGSGPADDFTDLHLAVAVQYGYRELRREPLGLQRGKRRRDRADILQRA